MSVGDRIFLDGKGLKNEKGSSISLGLTFTSEDDLDEALWSNPEQAHEPLRYLLKVHKGELTPTLSRLALKAMAIPLFIKEFQGEKTTDDVDTIVRRNSTLLNTYLNLLDDPSTNQIVLNRAINNSAVFQLGAREQTDTTLLPIGPKEYNRSPLLSFTALRHETTGEAASTNRYGIRMQPSEIVGPDFTVIELAEALVAEQQFDAVSDTDDDLINSATERLFTKIHSRFDKKE